MEKEVTLVEKKVSWTAEKESKAFFFNLGTAIEPKIEVPELLKRCILHSMQLDS